MTPKRHKKRLLRALTRLKREVRNLLRDKHLQYPYKSREEVERDIKHLCEEIERTELAK